MYDSQIATRVVSNSEMWFPDKIMMSCMKSVLTKLSKQLALDMKENKYTDFIHNDKSSTLSEERSDALRACFSNINIYASIASHAYPLTELGRHSHAVMFTQIATYLQNYEVDEDVNNVFDICCIKIIESELKIIYLLDEEKIMIKDLLIRSFYTMIRQSLWTVQEILERDLY